MDFEPERYLDTQAQPGLSMPFNLDAEQSVLGAVLLDAECLSVVAEVLPRAEYFYAVNNQLIYGAMLEMYTLGQPVDFVTVLEKLRESPDFDQEQGRVYLVQLAQLVPSVSSVETYARIVRDKYEIRTLMQAVRGILEEASAGTEESSLLLDSAEQRIYEIRQGKQVEGLKPIREILLETYDRLDLLNSPDRDKYRGIPTGIGLLDSTITGLNRSDLIVLAARPGVGKTSFGLNIARHASVVSKRRVAFFSLEMSREQLASRLLSTEASVEGTKLRSGDLNDDEWTRIIEAGDILGKAELYFDDAPGITVPQMKAKVRRLKNVDLVIVDYLQLMSGGKKTDNRVNEISDITRNLKIMAKELDVPVIAMSQLRRPTERSKDHRPGLSELRDSGSIEQDADIVIFLHREAYNAASEGGEVTEDMDTSAAQIIVAKNRHGATIDIDVHWQAEYMRFTSREVVRYE
ncbi:replicative DNA helicase [Acutalibacter muris]|jgi:replicative DNA helicase|uniref:Replicative DNA helicase n=1 Tax=Acutalibacter muris TaxID=1796620 RepID=A0A1Z2XV67_9FIRM|nr:replicative DNA helicase [Acutalibacter muris]ANU54448.1 replicative DNA helicase [Hungateiclostridiaceae bacterium KB18]ASB42330.1 replicative DNA helicase [Acutalibacter muris]QQR31611.1 replicative DNA helicase [Acutalibacter muris]